MVLMSLNKVHRESDSLVKTIIEGEQLATLREDIDLGPEWRSTWLWGICQDVNGALIGETPIS